MINFKIHYDYQTLIENTENGVTKNILLYVPTNKEPNIFFEYNSEKRTKVAAYYLIIKLLYLFLLEDDVYCGEKINREEKIVDGLYYVVKIEYFKVIFRNDTPLQVERFDYGGMPLSKSASYKIYYIDENSRIQRVYSLAKEYNSVFEVLGDYKNISCSYFDFTDDFFQELKDIDTLAFCLDNLEEFTEFLLNEIKNNNYILDFNIGSFKAGVA